MKKLFFISLAVSLIGISCTKDITRFNEQTKNAANVPGEMLSNFLTSDERNHFLGCGDFA